MADAKPRASVLQLRFAALPTTISVSGAFIHLPVRELPAMDQRRHDAIAEVTEVVNAHADAMRYLLALLIILEEGSYDRLDTCTGADTSAHA